LFFDVLKLDNTTASYMFAKLEFKYKEELLVYALSKGIKVDKNAISFCSANIIGRDGSNLNDIGMHAFL